MNEVKDTLKVIEDNYKLFLQQQFTFVGALQHTRENAYDMIRPVASISQVQNAQHKGLCCWEEGTVMNECTESCY